MPEKTEAPTPRRLTEARQKGQVARSAEVNTALLLVVGFWLLGPMGRRLAHEVGVFARWCFQDFVRHELTWAALSSAALSWGRHLGLLLLPFPVALLLTAIVANLIQTGFIFSFEALKPSLSKFNLVASLQRILSQQGLIELAKAAIKIGIVGLVAYGRIRAAYPSLLALPWGALVRAGDVAEGGARPGDAHRDDLHGPGCGGLYDPAEAVVAEPADDPSGADGRASPNRR